MLPEEEPYTITTAGDAVKLLRPHLEYLDHEEMWGLLLDQKNKVVANQRLYQGTVNSSVLRAGEIYRPALTRKCPSILIARNHPSGDPEPSPEDTVVTMQLAKAGELLDVELVDHLVIGHHSRFVSLKERMGW